MGRTPGTRRRWMLHALLCGALGMAGCGPAADAGAGPAAVPAATATGTDTTASDTPPTASGDADALDGAILFAAAAAGGGTLHAVGAHGGTAAAWTSDGDGVWVRVPVRGRAGATQLDAMALHGRSGVAFGGGASSSRLWTTDDGTTWRTAGGTVSGIDGRVNAVVADGDRWLAVGDRVDAEGGESYEGLVWVSTDGRSWDVLADGLELGEGTLSDVAVADGTVVVVGFDVDGGKVWTSTGDGAFDPVGGAVFDASTVQGVTATGDGFVALGRGLGDLTPVTWESADGRRWRSTDAVATDIRPDEEIHDLLAADGIAVAVGASPRGGVVWTLEDGRTWRRQT